MLFIATPVTGADGYALKNGSANTPKALKKKYFKKEFYPNKNGHIMLLKNLRGFERRLKQLCVPTNIIML